MRVPEALRRRWWLAPAAAGLVLVAVAVRILTAPLEVSANVSDGDREVARTAAIDLRFTQDMNASSVEQAFKIEPGVPLRFQAISKREFQFRPAMQPETNYQVQLKDAVASSGRAHVSRSLRFRTEPAPRVMQVAVNNGPLKDGQQGVRPEGEIKLGFSQPMDGPRTPLLVNGKTLDGKQLKWSGDGKTLTLDLRLGSSRQYQLSIPKLAVNRRQDPFVDDWKFAFGTIIEVPSQGAEGRIASGAPTLIQIDNIVDSRPQAGMQQADIVYEYIAEFGIPRLTALYWHPMPSLVGPVRSCRLITVRLLLMYRGMIYCSGANDYILGQVWNFPHLINDYSYGTGNVYYRAGDRPAPHNVMMRGDNATTYTASQNLPAPAYLIAPKHPDGTFKGDAAPQISVPDHAATWSYDPSSKQYFKSQDGAAFGDVNTGRLHAKTVVLQYVTSFLDRSPGNSFHGYFTEAYELTGEGKADIFIDGVVIHAIWKHPDANVPVAYYTADGDPIELDNGLTWVHVIGSEKRSSNF